MNKDYAYCINQSTCLHRRGCLAWLGNYSEQEAEDILDNCYEYIDDTKCIPDLKDVNCTNDYGFLDRFRYSDGTEMENKEKV